MGREDGGHGLPAAWAALLQGSGRGLLGPREGKGAVGGRTVVRGPSRSTQGDSVGGTHTIRSAVSKCLSEIQLSGIPGVVSQDVQR